MHNQTHVDECLANVRVIFEKASERIESLQSGQKVPATVLAAELAESIGMTGPQLYPTLLFLIKNYPGVDVKRGAHGGIIKR